MEIILIEGKSLGSKLIKLFTKSKFSHVALRYSGVESEWVIHSTIGGVQPEWWSYLAKKFDSIIRFECKFEVADQGADILVEKIGHKKYGYITILGIALVLMLSKIGIRLKKNPLGDPKTFLCTEVICEFLNICKKLDPDLNLKEFDSEMVDPKTILDYLGSTTQFFKKLD